MSWWLGGWIAGRIVGTFSAENSWLKVVETCVIQENKCFIGLVLSHEQFIDLENVYICYIWPFCTARGSFFKPIYCRAGLALIFPLTGSFTISRAGLAAESQVLRWVAGGEAHQLPAGQEGVGPEEGDQETDLQGCHPDPRQQPGPPCSAAEHVCLLLSYHRVCLQHQSVWCSWGRRSDSSTYSAITSRAAQENWFQPDLKDAGFCGQARPNLQPGRQVP